VEWKLGRVSTITCGDSDGYSFVTSIFVQTKKFLMKYNFSRNTKFNHLTVNYDNLDSVLI